MASTKDFHEEILIARPGDNVDAVGGIGGLYQWAGRFADRRLGIDTAGAIEDTELGLDPVKSAGYDASRWLALPALLPRVAVSERDVFADLGSGKGRVVLQAAQYYPFKRVIGVEISAELNRSARVNLDARRNRLRCPQVELVTADVLDWIPPDDLTIMWMFNPFRGEVFSSVITRLIELVERSGECVRIIYLNPTEDERLMQTGRVRRMHPPSTIRLKLAGLLRAGSTDTRFVRGVANPCAPGTVAQVSVQRRQLDPADRPPRTRCARTWRARPGAVAAPDAVREELSGRLCGVTVAVRRTHGEIVPANVLVDDHVTPIATSSAGRCGERPTSLFQRARC